MTKNIILTYILDKFQDYLNNFFVFKSLQSKIALMCGIISILISSSDGIKLLELLGQFFSFYFIARNIDCLIYGDCVFKSWVILLIPISGIFLSIAYRLDYFKKYKLQIKDNIEKINSVNHRDNKPLFNLKK